MKLKRADETKLFWLNRHRISTDAPDETPMTVTEYSSHSSPIIKKRRKSGVFNSLNQLVSQVGNRVTSAAQARRNWLKKRSVQIVHEAGTCSCGAGISRCAGPSHPWRSHTSTSHQRSAERTSFLLAFNLRTAFIRRFRTQLFFNTQQTVVLSNTV